MNFALFLVLVLQGDPDKRLDDIVRRLESDHIKERSRAQEELQMIAKEAPEKTLEALKAHLKRATDHEVIMRLRLVIDPIEANIKWLNLWTTKPSELADCYVKKTACPTCNKPGPWRASELKNDLLTHHLPDCKFFLLAWTCCQDKPVAPRVLAVAKQPDTNFEIKNTNDAWKGSLAPYMKPAATREEALQIGALVIGLWSFKESFDEMVKKLGRTGSVERSGQQFKATYETGTDSYFCSWSIEFDSEGRLAKASFQSGPQGSPGRGGALR
jgi:hypothetical protein